MNMIIAYLAGLLMGIGLCISQMVNPVKVIGFLDVFGDWDASLAFVMIGGLVVSAIGFQLKNKMAKPIVCNSFDVSTNKTIDKPLILGSILFGVGWGLAGYCPAPALTGMVFGHAKTYIFVLSMIVGMIIFDLCNRK